MKFLLIFSALIASSLAVIITTDTNCGKGTITLANEATSKIIGGQTVPKGNFGWTVLIHYNGGIVCNGAIVNSLWVITSAKCVYNRLVANFGIDIGVNDRNGWDSWSVTRRAAKAIFASNYNPSSFRNDIAMIKLSSPISIDTIYNRVIPICIPNGQEIYEGRFGYITGYGNPTTVNGQSSRYLLAAQTQVLSDARCRQKFSSYGIDSSTQLCAGDNGQNKDFCEYDDGAPLAVRGSNGRWHLVGIASWGGNPCGNGGVYTRTSAYTSFIINTINTQ